MPATETVTTNMKAWQSQEWRVLPLSIPALEVPINPPNAFVAINEWQQEQPIRGGEVKITEPVDEDLEDLEDARATMLRYSTRGIEEFTPYRAYRKERLQEE